MKCTGRTKRHSLLAGWERRAGLLRPFHRFPDPSTPALARLLVITRALDLFGQALFFAHLLEATEHLIERLITAGLHLDHSDDTFPGS